MYVLKNIIIKRGVLQKLLIVQMQQILLNSNVKKKLIDILVILEKLNKIPTNISQINKK